ncbi:hypothetical protein L208DRAFT_1511132 [Tricholoma matsutake]|nr:hypothetical protein L208DRAFT_1511132 [Tricholoma matsutake 945]
MSCDIIQGWMYLMEIGLTCHGVFLPIIIYMLNVLNPKVCDNLYTDQGLDWAFFMNIGVPDVDVLSPNCPEMKPAHVLPLELMEGICNTSRIKVEMEFEAVKDQLIVNSMYGALPIWTRDVDIAITAKTLDAFMEKAGIDSQFRTHSDMLWTYTCQGEGIENCMVEIEFLDIGGEFVPKLHGMTKFDTVYIALLADIALMKALAYQDWDMMVRRGETFTRYYFKQSEIEVISEVVETKGDAEAKRLLMQVARTAT